jgi:hypothetical protein
MSDESNLSVDVLEKKIAEIKKFKSQIYFVEFEDLFEYLFLSYEIIQIMQQELFKCKENNIIINSCYIFAAAVSDFYIPKEKMVTFVSP